MRTGYITVNGVVNEYIYERNSHRDTKHKPKCPSCDGVSQYVYHNHYRKQKKIGFICIFCNIVYIYSSYNVLKVRKNEN